MTAGTDSSTDCAVIDARRAARPRGQPHRELVRHSVADEVHVHPAVRGHVPNGEAEVDDDTESTRSSRCTDGVAGRTGPWGT